MNIKILILFIVCILLISIRTIAAQDYIYTPTTTGFTVTITANISGITQTSMNFTGKIGSTVYPEGTGNGKYRWGYIYNTGNSALNFQMASVTPSNIVLKVDAKSDMKHSFNVTGIPNHPTGNLWNGWKSVPYQYSADIFAVAIFYSNATKKFNVEVNVISQNDDTAPPITNISLSGTLGNNGWYISDVVATLSGTDDISGINYTNYRINSGSWLIYKNPFKVSIEGNNNISYYSVDNSNNREQTKYQIIKIDKTPPSSITNINNVHGKTYINWTWIDPTNLDFAYVMVYLNGIFKTNVTKGVRYYNATSLLNNTNYLLGTHTVDQAGNINGVWRNNTVKTNT